MKWEKVADWYKKPNGEILMVKKTVAEDTVEQSWVKLEHDGYGSYKKAEPSQPKPNKGEKANVRESGNSKK